MKKKFEEITQEIDELLVGELDLKTLTEKAATILSDKAGFIGVGIFVLEDNELALLSFSQNNITKIVTPLIKDIPETIRISLEFNKNIIIQSVKQKKNCSGTKP